MSRKKQLLDLLSWIRKVVQDIKMKYETGIVIPIRLFFCDSSVSCWNREG
ncbi:11879_t:CDS:2 [Ambispora gerdemannii]|uniref:11879_t:CDS:1 n=1 Tax=Ambispora gerdemannii TaxID=144530 RepID=A0A9N9BI61_9GLOM|nr:11879_t:CDS:2 [Ambispora gerdemannii]